MSQVPKKHRLKFVSGDVIEWTEREFDGGLDQVVIKTEDGQKLTLRVGGILLTFVAEYVRRRKAEKLKHLSDEDLLGI